MISVASGQPARHAPHVVEIAGLDEPRLVREHVEAGVVQAAHRARLAAVLAGEDHDVAAPLGDQPLERIVAA